MSVVRRWEDAGGQFRLRRRPADRRAVGLALLAGVMLLLGWEAGMWIALRTIRAKRATVPAR